MLNTGLQVFETTGIEQCNGFSFTMQIFETKPPVPLAGLCSHARPTRALLLFYGVVLGRQSPAGGPCGIRHRPFSLSLISLLLVGSITISCDDAMSSS